MEAPDWADAYWDALGEGWVCTVDLMKRVDGATHSTVCSRLVSMERGGKAESRVRGGRREWRRVSSDGARRSPAAAGSPVGSDRSRDIPVPPANVPLADEEDWLTAPPDAACEDSSVEPYIEEYGSGPRKPAGMVPGTKSEKRKRALDAVPGLKTAEELEK